MGKFLIFNLIAFVAMLWISEIPAVKERFNLQQEVDKVIDRFQALMDSAADSRDLSAESIGEPQSFNEQSILEIQKTLNSARSDVKGSINKESLIDKLGEQLKK